MTAKQSGNEEHTPNYQKTISWIIATLAGLATIVAAVNAILVPKKPVITIENRLELPIIVTINDSYNDRIQAGDTRKITLLSNKEFPAKVRWKVLRNRNNLGQPLGEEIHEEIRLVDQGVTLKVDNEIGLASYFYPVVLNNTDTKCSIIVNDGLSIRYVVGVSSPHTLTNITGYYKYASNSNVTLRCADQTYWLGKRNGKRAKEKSTPPRGNGMG